MKNIILILAGSLWLSGCGRPESQHVSRMGFTTGTSRDAILKQLEEMDAAILKDSPEFLQVEFREPGLKRSMQVELGFAHGKLARVNYIPK